MQIAARLHLIATQNAAGKTSVTRNSVNIWQILLITGILSLASACVYEVDVQQGNKLEPNDVEAIEAGMTRNQVRYLLGTPVVNDLFRDDRWDYIYYFRAGRSKTPERRWLIVWFDGNLVREVQRDVPVVIGDNPA
jgi:outer membrane protein assembly factor BamE